MQIKKLHILAWTAIMALALSSCKVSKQATTRYQSMTQRAQVTLQLDEHQYSMSCSMRTWHNELIVLSLQPMLGIEMVRIEADQDSIWIFDKMNRRYAAMDYASINRIVQPKVSYQILQDFCDQPIVPKKKETIQQVFASGKHQLTLTCTYSHREYNTLQTPTRTNSNKYKLVDLRTILPL